MQGEAGDHDGLIDADGERAIRNDTAEAGRPSVLSVRVVLGHERVELAVAD
jgi:hypothetical protein